MKIAVSGASGLIGRALLEGLRADGHDVLHLVRRTPRTADEHRWDPQHRRIDPGLLADVDAVINLAGAPIRPRPWTRGYREQLVSSRLDATTTISEALAAAQAADPSRRRVLVNASGIGYYGDTGDAPIREDAPPGTDFLARLCVQWEAATAPAADAGVRVVMLRTGLVLANGNADARDRARTGVPALGLGGRAGSGRQYWPWISLRDEIGAIRHLLATDVSGPVNLNAPTPATNAEFTRELGAVLHRPTLLAVPSFAISAGLGEFGRASVIGGQKAVPAKLLDSGYSFSDTRLDERCGRSSRRSEAGASAESLTRLDAPARGAAHQDQPHPRGSSPLHGAQRRGVRAVDRHDVVARPPVDHVHRRPVAVHLGRRHLDDRGSEAPELLPRVAQGRQLLGVRRGGVAARRVDAGQPDRGPGAEGLRPAPVQLLHHRPPISHGRRRLLPIRRRRPRSGRWLRPRRRGRHRRAGLLSGVAPPSTANQPATTAPVTASPRSARRAAAGARPRVGGTTTGAGRGRRPAPGGSARCVDRVRRRRVPSGPGSRTGSGRQACRRSSAKAAAVPRSCGSSASPRRRTSISSGRASGASSARSGSSPSAATASVSPGVAAFHGAIPVSAWKAAAATPNTSDAGPGAPPRATVGST